MPQDVPSSNGRRAKRVSRACDYCRRKRLKCTANQHPCLNCQLYNAECTTRDGGRRFAGRAEAAAAGPARADVSTLGMAEDQGSIDNHSVDPTTKSPSNAFDAELSAPQWVPEQDENEEAAARDFGHVLHQLGIGVSSDFWALDQTTPIDMSSVQADPNFMNAMSVVKGLVTDPNASPRNQGGPSAATVNGFASTPRSMVNSVHGKVSSIESLAKEQTSTSDSERLIPAGLFIRKDETVANYIGLSSVGATLALCLKDALESQSLRPSADSMGFLIESAPHVDEAGMESLLDLQSRKLPPRDTAIQSIDAYFANLDSFYPIIDEQPFRARCEKLYTSERPQLVALDYSLFFVVVSIGAISTSHTSPEPDDTDHVSIDAYEQAWSMLHDSIAAPSEASLQILLLHILRHLYYGKPGIAWVFCGLAIRMAQALGLHRKEPSDMDLPLSQLQLRARLWWNMHRLDANLSLSQGRPPGLSDLMYDREEAFAGAGGDKDDLFPGLSQVVTWALQLSQIQTRFCGIMHSRNTVHARLDAIVGIDEDLLAWKGSLPSTCAPGQHILVSPERHLHVVLMHLEYFNLVRAVHWAAITLKPCCGIDGDGSWLAPRIQVSEALCVEAARSFVKVLNDTMNQLRGTKIFMFGFQTTNYMAALGVLYRSISKDPLSFSARADLEHLRAGKMHLDRDIPRNTAGHALMALFENMLSTAQDLV
ncbi:hypothetical protein CEP53_013960 [Fusarium sp. AF-6]|nr:hypothetical protein CEP53_013960 [Fusarium sp. AF-6]